MIYHSFSHTCFASTILYSKNETGSMQPSSATCRGTMVCTTTSSCHCYICFWILNAGANYATKSLLRITRLFIPCYVASQYCLLMGARQSSSHESNLPHWDKLIDLYKTRQCQQQQCLLEINLYKPRRYCLCQVSQCSHYGRWQSVDMGLTLRIIRYWKDRYSIKEEWWGMDNCDRWQEEAT